MTPLDLFDDILGPLNPISRIIGGIEAWANVPHLREIRDHGLAGYAARSLGCITGLGMHWIAVPFNTTHKDFAQTLRLVRRYHIPTTHYYHTSKALFFAVPNQQATWAEAVIAADAAGRPYHAWSDNDGQRRSSRNRPQGTRQRQRSR